MEKCPAAQRLMTHPGVGPLTAPGFVLIIGEAERFRCGKQIASYLGLVPLEDSSGNPRAGLHCWCKRLQELQLIPPPVAQCQGSENQRSGNYHRDSPHCGSGGDFIRDGNADLIVASVLASLRLASSSTF